MFKTILLIVATVIAAPLICTATKPDLSQPFEAGLSNLKAQAERP